MTTNESILLPMLTDLLTYSSWQYQDTGRSLFLVGGSYVSIPGSHSLPSNKQTKYVSSYTTALHSYSLNSRAVQQSVSSTAAFSVTRQQHASKGSLDTVNPNVCTQ
jgi:hypothetical protein